MFSTKEKTKFEHIDDIEHIFLRKIEDLFSRHKETNILHDLSVGELEMLKELMSDASLEEISSPKFLLSLIAHMIVQDRQHLNYLTLIEDHDDVDLSSNEDENYQLACKLLR